MEKRGFKSRLLRKYRLTIHNVNKPDNVRGFYTSPILLILSLFIAFMLVAGVLYLVVIYTPVGSMLPGYVNKVEKDKIVTNSLRVDSLMQEIEKQDAYLATLSGVVLGSDAFFPFSDNIERAKKSGVSYIAEPGGSIRDDAVIEECNKRDMVMAVTHMRLFHH